MGYKQCHILEGLADYLNMQIIAAAHQIDAVYFVIAADFLGDFLKPEILF